MNNSSLFYYSDKGVVASVLSFYIPLYVYANVNMLIRQLQPCCIAMAQLVSVAPVVSMSSTSKMCFPSIASAFASENIPSAFFQRSSRVLCVCVSLALVRTTQSFITGIPLLSDNPSAI